MARHSSVSRKDRNAAKHKATISRLLTGCVGEMKALKFKDYDRLLLEAEQAVTLRNTLNALVDGGGEGAVLARQKLRALRDVKYYVDKPVSAGELHQKQGTDKPSNAARGSTGKHSNLMRGKSARDNQGTGI